MDKCKLKMKEAQKGLLESFAKKPGDFALTGGTALELYYLHHRFSADLDLFSPGYDRRQIQDIVRAFTKYSKAKVKLETEFVARNSAKVCFYSVLLKGLERPIKVDFVEDVLFDKPEIKKFGAVPVYSVEQIYFQKITAITGMQEIKDDIDRKFMQGRYEARDAFDIYVLSKKIRPLCMVMKELPRQFQRGIVHWYRTFSRQDIKLGILDLDIYADKFDSREMIIYLENEIEKFIKETIEE